LWNAFFAISFATVLSLEGQIADSVTAALPIPVTANERLRTPPEAAHHGSAEMTFSTLQPTPTPAA
jgi:hypothetical protein